VEGIAALFEGDDEERVRALWRACEADLGIAPAFPGARPHLTFHLVEERYPSDAVVPRLAELAREWQPFVVRTSGFGVFTGPNPVIYIPVVRDARLNALHEAIGRACSAAGVEPAAYYTPALWMPHITVAQQNIPAAALPEMLTWWAARDLAWELRITNLTIAHATEDSLEVRKRLDLRGR